MNESEEQRLKMAFRNTRIKCKIISINILNPNKNTPMENYDVLEPMEILKTTAVFRFIIPNVHKVCWWKAIIKGIHKVGFNGIKLNCWWLFMLVGSGIENKNDYRARFELQ